MYDIITGMMCECESERRVLQIYPDVIREGHMVFHEDGKLYRCLSEVKVTKEICCQCGNAYLIEVNYPVDGCNSEEIEWEDIE